MDFKKIIVPQMFSNEDISKIVHLAVKEGQFVKKGDVLGTLETTKAAFDLHSEDEGFVRGLQYKEGAEVRTGAFFGFISKDLNAPLPQTEVARSNGNGIRATNKALELIEQFNIPHHKLPQDRLLREKDVLAVLEDSKQWTVPSQAKRIIKDSYPKNAVVILGTGGHAKMCLDILRQTGQYEAIGFITNDAAPDTEIGHEVLSLPIIGRDRDLEFYCGKGILYAINGIGAVKEPVLREVVFNRLKKAGFAIPSLVHPHATVEPSAKIEEGVQVMAAAVVGSGAHVLANAIINTGAIVSHDCKIAAHAHIAPGAILGGNVRVGERSLIGMGVTVYLGLEIGSDVVIKNGIDIFSNVNSKSFVTT